MGETMKPCPWCQTTDHLRVNEIGSLTGDMPDRPYQVRCSHLDCEDVSGPVQYGRAAAIEAWNLYASPPDAGATGEEGWLIEYGDSPTDRPRYWAGSAPYATVSDPARTSSWTENHLQAIRFAREVDAKRVVMRFMGDIPTRVCLHDWAGASLSPDASTSAGVVTDAMVEAAWLAFDNACPGEHWKQRERIRAALEAALAPSPDASGLREWLDDGPKFGKPRRAEPGLRHLIYHYYATYFGAETAQRHTEAYVAALTGDS